MKQEDVLDKDAVLETEANHIGIIDYGICNVGSVRNMLRRSGILASCISSPDEMDACDRIILPGVGHFSAGMANLEKGGWIDPIRHAALKQRKPILGICLGMQLLAHHSEEGDCEGLGLLDMDVKHFDRSRLGPRLPIPHMGWSEVDADHDHPLTHSELPEKQRFYFVHSLHVVPRSEKVQALFWCNYGYPFVAGCARDNVMGVQFHPEKSHMFGVEILTNFAGI
ncbi:imidazole glycerol phosphate synthase subunit HisH [Erythrobacter litoralis]|uniref:Imidazole glycerol phosphate synthase subunit HisH n=1 Tax=Erythrobacter litoralis (strain HTCC2594) TaxID=314225 RepID=Q2N6D1_ERYLH|nr:imidazole glycerol phosphate synthase subunit HisH [Erythrobacter litoralis]ABC64760.1 glutamine amidotransferase [Erythrobacter litoralis HTCC2594]